MYGLWFRRIFYHDKILGFANVLPVLQTLFLSQRDHVGPQILPI
jgi:hypothetical protein